MPEITIARRMALKLLAGAALLPIVGRPALATAAPGVDFIVIADLHSAYDHLGQLLAAIESHVAATPRPCLVLFNGDLFEAGNVVASRSGGAIDWAFLKALADTAPTVFNLGNHEPDLDNDLAHFVTRAGELGITVLTNIIDGRTGAGYAPASATLQLGDQSVTVAACTTDNLFTYPKPTRAQLSIPRPAEWAAANLPGLLRSGTINVMLSHAGVTADKAILPLLPDGTLFVGGHDHLNLVHAEGNTRYLHTGSWSEALTVATVAAPGAPADLRRIGIDPAAPASGRLAGLIADVLALHVDFVKANPDAVQKIVAALSEATDFIQKNPAEAAKIMATELKEKPEETLEGNKTIQFYNLKDNLALFGTKEKPGALFEVAKIAGEFYVGQKILTKVPDVSQVIDSTFITKIK